MTYQVDEKVFLFNVPSDVYGKSLLNWFMSQGLTYPQAKAAKRQYLDQGLARQKEERAK